MSEYLLVSVDIETRARVDLWQQGMYRYFDDPETDLICLSFYYDGEVHTWIPPWVCDIFGEPHLSHPFEILEEENDIENIVFTAWNSAFDRRGVKLCVERYGFPEWCADPERWLCTSATSRANGLPAKLDNAAKALKIPQQKMQRGKELIQLLSIPQPDTQQFREDADLIEEMIAYCEQDVLTEMNVVQHLRPFSLEEWQDFKVNEYVNDRGCPVDIDFARTAVRYADEERDVLEQELFALTNGVIERPTQSARIKNYMLDNELLSEKAMAMCEVTKVKKTIVKGKPVFTKKKVFSLDKTVRNNLLVGYEDDMAMLRPDGYELLALMDKSNKSSIAKYRRMISSHVDGRLNGMLMFNGASSTGRSSGKIVQPHNFPRASVEDFDKTAKGLKRNPNRVKTLATMLRQTIKAPKGKTLAWSDYSNIENRIAPWLSRSRNGEKKLKQFAYCDAHPDEPDMYERQAEMMGFKERQTGKIAELSLTFLGGAGALIGMAKGYGTVFTEKEAEVIKEAWRNVNGWAPKYGRSLHDAAVLAIRKPGKLVQAGRVAYAYTPDSHNGLGTLWCSLPSGRRLGYPSPKISKEPAPWSTEEKPAYVTQLTALKSTMFPMAGEKEWPRNTLWPGLLLENITQATAHDLLRYAKRMLHAEGFKIVLDVHDEIVIELPKRGAAKKMQRFHEIMNTAPDWLTNFPLAADLNYGERYSK